MGGVLNWLPDVDKPTDPLAQAGQAMQLRSMAGQQQLQQQALKGGDLDIQEKQVQMDAQKRMNAVLTGQNSPQTPSPTPQPTAPGAPTGSPAAQQQPSVSPNKVLRPDYQSLLSAGGTFALPLVKSYIEMDTKRAELAKVQQEMQDKTIDHMAGVAGAIRALKDPQTGLTDMNGLNQIIAHESADPVYGQQAQAAGARILSITDPVARQQAIDHYVDTTSAMSEKYMTAQAAAQRGQSQLLQAQTQADKQAREAAGQSADSNAKARANLATQLANAPNQDTYNTIRDNASHGVASQFPDLFDPNKDKRKILALGMTPEQQTQAGQRDQQLVIENGRLSIEKNKLAIERLNAGLGTDGKPIVAGTTSPLVEAINNGQIDAPTYRVMARRYPGVVQQLLAAHPDFTELNVESRYKFNNQLQNYGPSGLGGQRNAINTAVDHLDLAYKMVDAVNNGQFKPGNQLYNTVKTAFGWAPSNNLDSVNNFIATEVSKMSHGGVPNQKEIDDFQKTLKSNMASGQYKSAVDQAFMPIIAGRAQPINAAAAQASMPDNFNVLGAKQQSILKEHGIDPDQFAAAPGDKTTAFNGATAPPPPAANVSGKPPKAPTKGTTQIDTPTGTWGWK